MPTTQLLLPSFLLRNSYHIFSRVNRKKGELQIPPAATLIYFYHQINYMHLVLELGFPAIWSLLIGRSHPLHVSETEGEALVSGGEGEGVVEVWRRVCGRGWQDNWGGLDGRGRGEEGGCVSEGGKEADCE